MGVFLVELGRGKDGVCFFDKNKGYIYKKLSPFGLIYHPITRYLQSYLEVQEYCWDRFFRIQDFDGGYYYSAEPYTKVGISELGKYLRDYCRLQSSLLCFGIGITDMGLGIDKLNFMKTKDGSFKWIDYGGLGFAFDRRHVEVHEVLSPKILSNFEGVSRREIVNKLDSRLMMLFFCHQLDAIYSKKPMDDIGLALFQIRRNEVLLDEFFQTYEPACALTTTLYNKHRLSDWTNEKTWLSLISVLDL